LRLFPARIPRTRVLNQPTDFIEVWSLPGGAPTCKGGFRHLKVFRGFGGRDEVVRKIESGRSSNKRHSFLLPREFSRSKNHIRPIFVNNREIAAEKNFRDLHTAI
jgi:hypothetical protein